MPDYTVNPEAIASHINRTSESLHSIDWFLILVSFFGAFLLYIISKNNNKAPFSLLKALNVKMDTNTAWYIVLADIILISGIGAIGVYFLTCPQTPAQAIASGLGFAGLIGAVNT